jgi:N-formylglutamate amidohydrolase
MKSHGALSAAAVGGLMEQVEGAAVQDFDRAFETIEPARLASPLVFSSPHSGSTYPQRFLAASRLDPLTLRRSEDAFVDELFLPCVGLGAPLLRALFPRAYLDVNREPYELDPQIFDGRLPEFANTRSLRVAVGLGTIPRVVGDAQPIYRKPIPVADGLRRIETLYQPYHTELKALIERARGWFGLAVLIDCHSMPSNAADVSGLDIVLGDRFGASSAPAIVDVLESSLKRAGYRVRRNKPFAGGYITEHFGAPADGAHAVQIEIARALYLDERRIVRTERWTAVQEDLFAAAKALALELGGNPETGRLAAE